MANMTEPEIVNMIVKKQHNGVMTNPLDINMRFIPSAADLMMWEKWCAIPGNDPARYAYKYHMFELHLMDGRTYNQILTGSIDFSDANVIKFETDVDTGVSTAVMVAGSPIAKTIIDENGKVYISRRVVIINYEKIVSVEFTRLIPNILSEYTNSGGFAEESGDPVPSGEPT